MTESTSGGAVLDVSLRFGRLLSQIWIVVDRVELCDDVSDECEESLQVFLQHANSTMIVHVHTSRQRTQASRRRRGQRRALVHAERAGGVSCNVIQCKREEIER